jgi:REP element-mobilizing transposase RayT
MPPQPIYTSENTRPVHNLLFDWTGWFAKDCAAKAAEFANVVEGCRAAWKGDGFELDTFRVKPDSVQVLAKVEPGVSPVVFAQRVKGRLDHAARKAGVTVKFSKKLAVRTLGDNRREQVEGYVRRQVENSDYVDPRFRKWLGAFNLADGSVHLEEASATARGRYWYNLHLVIVVQDRRWPVTRYDNFETLRDTCGKIAAKKGYAISRLAVMPDHIHAALRGAVAASPEEIGLAFLNNLSWVMGYNRCWSWEYYVGSFSEYDVRAVRR